MQRALFDLVRFDFFRHSFFFTFSRLLLLAIWKFVYVNFIRGSNLIWRISSEIVAICFHFWWQLICYCKFIDIWIVCSVVHWIEGVTICFSTGFLHIFFSTTTFCVCGYDTFGCWTDLKRKFYGCFASFIMTTHTHNAIEMKQIDSSLSTWTGHLFED